jgi:hypothetical protein
VDSILEPADDRFVNERIGLLATVDSNAWMLGDISAVLLWAQRSYGGMMQGDYRSFAYSARRQTRTMEPESSIWLSEPEWPSRWAKTIDLNRVQQVSIPCSQNRSNDLLKAVENGGK